MDTKKITRRQALRGLGGLTLSLPFMASLLPRELWAATATTPKRFVAIANFDGYYESVYYPSVATDQTFASDVVYKSLASINGDISELLTNQFDGFRSKMNIYRGLDIAGSVGHSAANMLCGAARKVFGDDNPIDPLGTSCSMDVVLSKSKNFYQQAPAFLALRGQEPSYNYSVSFDKDSAGNTIRVPYMTTPIDMFQQTFGSTITDPKTQADFQSKKMMLGDLVLSDYQKLRNGRRISADDKITLDNFISRLQDLNNKINQTQTQMAACRAPTLRTLSTSYWDIMTATDQENMFSNYIDIMVAAMACDLTRISVISMRLFGHDHGLSHADPTDRGNQLKYLADRQRIAKVVKEFASKMDAIIDPNGKTMLDNSILFWGNEDANGGPHTCMSMPAISFGSAGGNIKTGYFMDYRQNPRFLHPDGQYLGRSYTQLLITFMKSLGLPPDDYLKFGDGGGFGSFNRDAGYTQQHYYPYEALRNDTLPFISLV